ncbi:DNA-directed DNA polymerase [Hyperthermus butylicus]|uniref:DNA polymerase n=1 Tax=Hyperthermus butylicus (strain DSM 5456 / JCM 9403 / PLM1-5) TaxID=415426 RepID=A2BL84_HYPBU|nr:DNA polymerase II [Hyperthermus butylicus]ABM80745.1 DNA polymerase III [Hyperthermus butylicus DSM 5456]
MAEEIEFVLLDSSYEIVGKEPVIVLWGVTLSGERVVLLDRRFRPYFYALIKRGFEENATAIAAAIRRLSKGSSPIIALEVVDKKYFGRPRKAVRVTTVIPESVREYREAVKKIDGVEDALEADIRFAMRYIIDKRLYPFMVYRVPVEDVGKNPGYRVDKVFYVTGEPQRITDITRIDMPDLRLTAFDIEVYNKSGSPNPNRDPVIIIAVKSSNGDEKLFEADGYDDRKAIRGFVDYIKSFDPDIIVGYNSNGFDWPYLMQRARKVGVRLDVTRRVGAEPTTSVYGHVSVPGRLNVDLYHYAEEIHEVKVKTLEEVAEYLGVMKKSERVLIHWWEIPRYWEDPEKRPILEQYARDDVRATYGLAEKMLPFAIQLSTVTGIPLDQVGVMGVGFRLEWYLIRAAYEMNELVPNRVERHEESYRGAVVLKPLKGVHENVVVLDFSSMYPNIMIKYNVGPDTIVDDPAECEKYGGCYVAPEVGHRFRKQPPGFFKTVLENLLRLRKQVREKMKELPPESPEYRLYDERQRALKVLANASYGYMGWSGARWYCKRCAEAVTAWGRSLILSAIEYARKLGLKVIYGDTDSLFVTYDPEKVKKLIDYVVNVLGFEIKIDKIYRRVFFTEAKKRYVGLLEDGRIDIVGFEAVRGDWCELAKEVQSTVAEIVLKTGKIDEAIRYIRDVIKKLREGEIPVEKLIIWKTLSKRLEEYEHEAPHVVAARRMKEAGYDVSPGDKIGYVIVRGAGRISSRAYPYFMVKPSDIDVDYYIDHQIVPAVLRILSYFGVTEKQLKAASTGHRTLFDFMRGKRG